MRFFQYKLHLCWKKENIIISNINSFYVGKTHIAFSCTVAVYRVTTISKHFLRNIVLPSTDL